MDEFSIELSRGLYNQSLSYASRQEQCTLNPHHSLDAETSSRFLISQINLKSVSYLMLFTMVLASVAMMISSHRSVNFLMGELRQHSERTQSLITYSKDLEITVREILAAEREQFTSELGKTRMLQDELIEQHSHRVQQKVGVLEHGLRGTSSFELLNTFQVTFEEWKIQHEEWAQKFTFGNVDATYASFDEEIVPLKERLFASAYNLSATVEDYQRRELARIEQQSDFFKTRLKFSEIFLAVTLGVFFWSTTNFLGALSEFMRWFRKQTWDLHVESKKLEGIAKNPQDTSSAEELSRQLSAQSAQMKLVLAQLMEAFSGEINGERAPWKSKLVQVQSQFDLPKILNFEVGVQKMKNLLNATPQSIEKSVDSEKKAVGE